jgi:hypothetical protein
MTRIVPNTVFISRTIRHTEANVSNMGGVSFKYLHSVGNEAPSLDASLKAKQNISYYGHEHIGPDEWASSVRVRSPGPTNASVMSRMMHGE